MCCTCSFNILTRSLPYISNPEETFTGAPLWSGIQLTLSKGVCSTGAVGAIALINFETEVQTTILELRV